MNKSPETLRRYAAGLRGENELKVGPQMAALQLDEAADHIEELKAKLAKEVDALIWCSGSRDFAEGGIAREGWLKLCAPIINADLKGGDA